MYYKIVEYFGPATGPAWTEYLKWRKLPLSTFDSIDALLRRDLFSPESEAEWAQCISDFNQSPVITNLEFAVETLGKRNEKAQLIGVIPNIESCANPTENLLGFDIVDGSATGISLLTNWGTDDQGLFSPHISSNGLILDCSVALATRDLLRQTFSHDSHATDCEVCAIYEVVLPKCHV